MGIHTRHASLALAVLLLPASLDTLRDGSQDDTPPRVPAGVIEWHPTLDAARETAAVSGKPILLFELFGRLDEARC